MTFKPPSDPKFAAWLRASRTAVGLTQEALAQRAGCSVTSISKWENGHPVLKIYKEKLRSILIEAQAVHHGT